jgi:2-polyprenyl-3-methyl-5-hydroxy-6-metoxy-1,4-benzoquinol methylase
MQSSNQVKSSEQNGPPVCPYCTSATQLLVVAKDSNRQTTDLTFHYFQCKDCGLVFMNPIPADLRPFYKGGYQKIPGSLSELRAIAEAEKYRMKPILKYKTGGRLLEIGPWMGIFSCNAKDAGFDVTAIDIDEDCIHFLNEVVGVKALQSSDPAETIKNMEEKFDVIAMWHCLEHLPNAWTTVQSAAERLAPGGILLIAIPNIESHEFLSLKSDWRHLDAPRHLYFYPEKSLVQLCRSNGLVPVEITTTDELSDALSRDAWFKWSRSRVRVKYIRHILGHLRYQRTKTIASKNPLRGSGLTAIFRQP